MSGLRTELEARVLTATLDRPQARNALDRELILALAQLARGVSDDDAVDVLVVTGADPAFCAGIDLKELGSPDRGDDGERLDDVGRGPVPDMSKPLIGAVNGVAVTGGLELALACDFLIASDRARFADTHSRVGIQPGWGLTVALPAAVGVRRAKEMSTTGNFVDAATALSWGLVNHVVPHDDLLTSCRRLASDIVSNDQPGVRRLVETYDEGALVTGAEARDLESRVSREWMASGRGGSPDDVEARRRRVVERGRSQVD